MTASLSVCLASSGTCSVKRTPGRVVGTVPNSPRTSAGASGLGAKVSWWLGPPCIHRRMQLTDFPPAGGCLAPAGREVVALHAEEGVERQAQRGQAADAEEGAAGDAAAIGGASGVQVEHGLTQ